MGAATERTGVYMHGTGLLGKDVMLCECNSCTVHSYKLASPNRMQTYVHKTLLKITPILAISQWGLSFELQVLQLNPESPIMGSDEGAKLYIDR